MKRVVFMGSKRVGMRCLETMSDTVPGSVVAGITVDDRNDARSVYNEFVSFGRHRDVQIHAVGGRGEMRSVLRQIAPDLCIVAGWYWLIPEDLLASIRGGFVGVHFSLLPRYRGGSPLVWAMINGERETGVSLFSMVKNVDAGDIWGQRRLTIEPDEYIGSVLARLEDLTTQLLAHLYPAMLTGSARAEPQNHALATVFPPRTPNDGLIDWTRSASEILRFVRAQSWPYPGAFTVAGGRRLIIWRASAAGSVQGSPGQVLRTERGVVVVCGDLNAILVQEAEHEGVVGPLGDLIDANVNVLGDHRAPAP